MLRIVRQRLQLSLEGSAACEFEKQIASTLSPLISGVRREYFKRLGLGGEEIEKWMQREVKEASPLLAGDLFIRDQDTVTYYRVPREESVLEAGIITRADPGEHKDFFEAVLQIARKVSGDKKLDWKAPEIEGDAESALSPETPVAEPTAEDISGSRELENPEAQALIRQIIASGSIFFNKLTQAVNQNRNQMERQIERFEELGLVSKDFAVLCRKTGQQILRVSSRAAIEDPSQKGFKCFICGNPVSEESIDEIITPTDFGRKLLEGDYWLVVRVLDALEHAGIHNQEVHIHSGEGRLTNFFVTINDQLYLIIVANNKVSLEDSYLINAHLAAYAVKNAIVICTERISRLMRNHLEKSNEACAFDFIDSLQNLEDRFASILRQKEKSALRKVLENFSTLTPVCVQEVVMQRISPETETLERTETPAPRARGKKNPAAAPVEVVETETEVAETPAPAAEEPVAQAAEPEPEPEPEGNEFLVGEVFEEALPEESTAST